MPLGCIASAYSRDDPAAELAARTFPMTPDAKLESAEVLRILVGGLQHNDVPKQDTGGCHRI